MKKYFFGWTNIKWFIREMVAMYSDQNGYFSKKRFESSIAFLSATWLILWHAYISKATITNSEILADAVVLFGIAGYTVRAIQAEKITSKTSQQPDQPEEEKKEE